MPLLNTMKTFNASRFFVLLAAVALALPVGAFAMSRPAAKPDPTPEATAEQTEEKKAESGPSSDARRAQVTVLGYHRFVNKVNRPDTEITPAEFEAQMQALKDNGITVITLDDFLAWKKGEKEIPLKSALITLDDGWKSQYDIAWPILKKYGYPFTMFIYTDYVKGGKRTGGESMSWEQLAEMRDAGVNIEGHTVSHQDLRGKKGFRDTPEYDEWLRRELVDSKQMIENKLGVKVRALALPYGFYNEKVQKAAEEAGYEAIFTVNGQKVTFGTPNNAIGRWVIESNKPKLFISAIQFGGGGESAAAPVAEITNSGLNPHPADGAKIADPQPEIKADLTAFGKFNPNTLSVRISGIGLVKGHYDEATKTFTYKPTKKLPDNTYTVIITAGPQGKRQEGRWSFTIAADEKEEAVAEKAEKPEARETKPEEPAPDPATPPADNSIIGKDVEE